MHANRRGGGKRFGSDGRDKRWRRRLTILTEALRDNARVPNTRARPISPAPSTRRRWSSLVIASSTGRQSTLSGFTLPFVYGPPRFKSALIPWFSFGVSIRVHVQAPHQRIHIHTAWDTVSIRISVRASASQHIPGSFWQLSSLRHHQILA
ncbi:hypothetical protein G6O67_002495 [Ophiocordyceps sinensis]|uniref:Uncharacterized protein n=1 Tax=Ophiocordyceps sinensis TaxID=72228 RepID=A0A8H4V7C6_9HYPO|nr:hypothetical protein G6O67_002495 [Ophiocordyceps sinensis]